MNFNYLLLFMSTAWHLRLRQYYPGQEVINEKNNPVLAEPPHYKEKQTLLPHPISHDEHHGKRTPCKRSHDGKAKKTKLIDIDGKERRSSESGTEDSNSKDGSECGSTTSRKRKTVRDDARIDMRKMVLEHKLHKSMEASSEQENIHTTTTIDSGIASNSSGTTADSSTVEKHLKKRKAQREDNTSHIEAMKQERRSSTNNISSCLTHKFNSNDDIPNDTESKNTYLNSITKSQTPTSIPSAQNVKKSNTEILKVTTPQTPTTLTATTVASTSSATQKIPKLPEPTVPATPLPLVPQTPFIHREAYVNSLNQKEPEIKIQVQIKSDEPSLPSSSNTSAITNTPNTKTSKSTVQPPIPAPLPPQMPPQMPQSVQSKSLPANLSRSTSYATETLFNAGVTVTQSTLPAQAGHVNVLSVVTEPATICQPQLVVDHEEEVTVSEELIEYTPLSTSAATPTLPTITTKTAVTFPPLPPEIAPALPPPPPIVQLENNTLLLATPLAGTSNHQTTRTVVIVPQASLKTKNNNSSVNVRVTSTGAAEQQQLERKAHKIIKVSSISKPPNSAPADLLSSIMASMDNSNAATTSASNTHNYSSSLH